MIVKLKYLCLVIMFVIGTISCNKKNDSQKKFIVKSVLIEDMNFEYPFTSGDVYTSEITQQIKFIEYDVIKKYIERDKSKAAKIKFSNLTLHNLKYGFKNLVTNSLNYPYFEIDKNYSSISSLIFYKHLLLRNPKDYIMSDAVLLIEYPQGDYKVRLIGNINSKKTLQYIYKEDSLSQDAYNSYIKEKINSDNQFYMHYIKWNNRGIGSLSEVNEHFKTDTYWGINQGTDSLWTNLSLNTIKQLYPKFKGVYIYRHVEIIELNYGLERRNKDFFKGIKFIN